VRFEGVNRRAVVGRQDLNYPPTAVGGITKKNASDLFVGSA